MSLTRIVFAIALAAATPAFADPLADMDGNWRGSGWARETQQGPQEAVRCRINNTYDAATLTLTLTGDCAVPGRRLSVSGTLIGTDGAERITGRWANPDGVGSVAILGVQRGDVVAFNFNVTDPATGRDMAQNVEWRLVEGALRLRSTDRRDPSIMMSDITFRR